MYAVAQANALCAKERVMAASASIARGQASVRNARELAGEKPIM
jgi:hypothetical protein